MCRTAYKKKRQCTRKYNRLITAGSTHSVGYVSLGFCILMTCQLRKQIKLLSSCFFVRATGMCSPSAVCMFFLQSFLSFPLRFSCITFFRTPMVCFACFSFFFFYFFIFYFSLYFTFSPLFLSVWLVLFCYRTWYASILPEF